MIKVVYRSLDGYREARKYKSLKGAQKFAQKWVGKHPEIGSSYAVSGDGIGKIEVWGASLADLFPPAEPAPAPEGEPAEEEWDWLNDYNYVGSRWHY